MATKRCDEPTAPPDSSDNLVLRRDRDELAQVIRRYMNDEISAFAFDEQLNAFRNSPDSTVCFVSNALWFFYDDCTDHLAVLSKTEWDFFQRLLLLMESDGVVETVVSRRWSFTQLAALAALIGFGWVAMRLGWGYHLLAAAMPFGAVSIGIAWFREATAAADPCDPLAFPFTGFAELRAVYKAAAFTKAPYPRRIAPRQIRSPLLTRTIQLRTYVVWLMLSPIVLLFQTLPIRQTQTRVIPFGPKQPQPDGPVARPSRPEAT